MKEKSQIEKKAEARQAELLSAALGGASNAGGHWLNVSGKGFPRLYPQGVSASPFNALLWPCIRTITDARPTCSRFTVKPRHGCCGAGA